MNKTCRLGGAAALAAIIAATAFVSEASANPFNFFGQPLFGYGPPTDNGNQARADLQRRVVDFRSNEAPVIRISISFFPAGRPSGMVSESAVRVSPGPA
jgi:hypothetical protein